ncbi:SIS domain-containing protein [Candidatus Parcubacteria bacterium]|nr:SIS domain-containing protein [Candidatus Parcubacteria bacterium]
MAKKQVEAILEEIRTVLSKVDDSEIDKLLSAITEAKKVVSVGAGRVGMAVRGFAMRLGHLGLASHMVGDATVPSVAHGDLLFVASGSGETETIYQIVNIAKKNGAGVALITGNPQSRMGELADIIVKVSAPSKVKAVEGLKSVQPMTTLNEQSLGILFDAIVLRLMEEMGETHETMWARHSNLE